MGVSGCAGISSLNSAATPVELYLLTPKSTFDASLPRIREQIVVQEPTATAVVATDRITVQPTPLRVQYLPEARWIDRAPLIVQTLLIESFENSGRVPAVGRSQVGLRADYLIVTDIREFQAEVIPSTDPAVPDAGVLQVHVRLNIKVVDADLDRIVGSRSFEEIELSASDEPEEIVAAFDEALGDAMRDAVEWSVRTIYSNR